MSKTVVSRVVDVELNDMEGNYPKALNCFDKRGKLETKRSEKTTGSNRVLLFTNRNEQQSTLAVL
jgi:hypothetical protein